MNRALAVLDQGSSATKGAVISPDGETLELVSIPVALHRDDAHVSFDAGTVADDVVSLARRLIRDHRVAALGLACQRSTCLIWERATGRPLTPALSWQDTSQASRVALLSRHADLIRARTGLRLSAYYAAPKLAALLESLPDGAERASGGELVGGTLDAFLVHRLTGCPATEPGTAGRTLLFDLEHGEWDDALCDLFGLPHRLLPDLRTSAGDWGNFEGTPLLAVAGDQQASLLGHGGWSAGTVMAHFGTGAFVLASTGSEIVRHDGLLSAVSASTPRGRHFQIEAPVNSAGSAVDWARELTGVDLDQWTDRSLVEERPWVLPAFSGLGAPTWRGNARAVIAHLDLSTSPEALFSGVLAGIAHRVVDCLDAVREAGVRVGTLRVSGKLARLRGLMRFLSDIARTPLEISGEEETGLQGLVRLVTSQLEESDTALERPTTVAHRIEPEGSADGTARERGAWQRFVHGALELQAPPARVVDRPATISGERPDDYTDR